VTGPRTADAIVIGGGVIGASAAFHLARSGARCVLFEARHLASGASGACDGCLFLQTKRPGPHLDFARRSVEALRRLLPDLDADVEYDRCGGLVLAEEGDADALRRHFETAKAAGLGVEWLEGLSLHAAEPALGPAVAAAVRSAQDGRLDPLALTRGLALTARRRGATLRLHEQVRAIRAVGDRVTGVATDKGSWDAPTVVLAAGAWAADLARTVGLDLPVRPRRGQLLVTEPTPPLLRHIMIEVRYLAGKFGAGGLAFSAEQTRRGAMLLGGTREEAGYDRRTDPRAVSAIASRAVRFVPALAGVAVVRAFAGLRPATPDGLPIIDAPGSPAGLVLACGFEGDGISLAVGAGELAAALARGEGASPFRLDRFAAAAPQADRATGDGTCAAPSPTRPRGARRGRAAPG
jgi:sarcosine oxidase subunit beta